MDHRLRLPNITLLLVAGISCLLVLTLLASAEVATGSTNAPTEVNTLPCQPDSALNALLIQMLMALQPHLLFQQQPRWPAVSNSNNELVVSTPEPIVTTVVTSSVVSTLTQTLSKVVSIWFRNERIPTTLYSQTTSLVTDYITVTSTVRGNVVPTDRVRERREVKEEAILLESSLSENDRTTYDTRPLPWAEPIRMSVPPDILIQPRVVEAWSNFLHVLEEVHNGIGDKK